MPILNRMRSYASGTITLCVTSMAVLLIAGLVSAQPPQGERGRGGGRDARRGGMRMPPGFNLMTALDVDKDGKLSAKEIENAEASLKTLDKDQNGKLSGKEIGWPPSMEGMFGGRGGRGGGFGRRGGPPERPALDDDVLKEK